MTELEEKDTQAVPVPGMKTISASISGRFAAIPG